MPRPESLPTVTDCEGCGVCCLHMGYPAYIQATETQPAESHWVSMPGELKSELLDYMSRYERPEGELDGPCHWFDQQARRCMHHEHRPRVCRDFQVGSQGCVDWRHHYGDRIGDSKDCS